MKVVYRTTYERSFYRLLRFSETGNAISRKINHYRKPYLLTPDDELFKYGYRYTERNFKNFSAVFLGLFSGVFLYYSYILSMQHQQTTINAYKLNQHIKSTPKIWLRTRLIDYCYFHVGYALQPFHDFFKYVADYMLPPNFQRVLRVLQYRYFMKKKNRKYDILDLGVIENFPLPPPSNTGSTDASQAQ